jgi:hypothetical protein
VLAIVAPEAGSIPLWILILAIVAGLLFLSLLTYILHRLGFFKRKRPEDFNYTAKIQVRASSGLVLPGELQLVGILLKKKIKFSSYIRKFRGIGCKVIDRRLLNI